MALFDLIDLTLDGTTPTLQVMEVGLAADPPPAGGVVLRLMEVRLAGTGGAPVLTAGPVTPDGEVRGGTTVALSVTVDDTWTDVEWVLQPEGLQVELAGGALAKQFIAPYTPEGGAVLLSVTATGPGGDSAPVFFGVAVTAHPDWYLHGGVWKPTLASDSMGD